jgi:hypothetical protein
MPADKLHQFDVALCAYALDNIRSYMEKPAFAAYVEERIEPPVLAYLKALGDEIEPEPMLLNERELDDLADTFAGGPLEFDRPWTPYEPLHGRCIDCVLEIRNGLAPEYAESWAQASAQFTETLEEGRVRLGGCLLIVREWVGQVRRLLRAMGEVAYLPVPEGAFPTPSHPEPSPLACPPVVACTRHDKQRDNGMMAAITETQALQREVRDLLLSQRTVKDYYTTAEVGAIVGKAEFTVREWCRNGRVHGQKQESGRGQHQAWVISHAELQRFQRDGLLPVRPVD